MRPRLDALVRAYGASRLPSDPLSLVRPFPDPRDREVAGLVTAGLAFGNVRQVLRSAGAVLSVLGRRPARAAAGKGLDRSLAGFRHRWVGGPDVVLLLRAAAAALAGWGSLEAFFLDGEAPGLRGRISSFSRRLRELAGGGGRGLRYLLPDPATGGASKRLCLWLRWMVRPDDGVDLGVWAGVAPADLVIPLDTHVLRISRYLGLTARRTAGWATAREITDALARLCPEDPVRYDFALAQLGISRDCRHRRIEEVCSACPLEEVCALSRPGGRTAAG